MQLLDMNPLVKLWLTKTSTKDPQELLQELKTLRDLSIKMADYPDFFKRSVFKKSVLTVGNYGAKQSTVREDVLEQLKHVDPSILQDLSKDELKIMCRLVYLQIGGTIPAAGDYLDWSRKLTYIIAKNLNCIQFNHPMTDFPVYTAVNESESIEIVNRYKGRRIVTVLKKRTDECNPRKTSTAAVPLIIHSTDAAILVKTAEKMVTKNNPMLLVHDSFGTTPNEMTGMKSDINDVLVETSESGILQKIVDQFIEQLLSKEVPAIKVVEQIMKLGLDCAPYQGTMKDIKETILSNEHGFS